MRQLRDYQQEAVAAVHAEWAAGRNRTGVALPTGVVLPTGTGKTDILAAPAVEIARQGGRVLVLAHRGELLDQITERCAMHAPELPRAGRMQGSRTTGIRRPILAAMVSTLRHERRQRQLVRPGKPYPFDLIIVDECHHAASPSYMNVLAWAGAFDGVPTLGMTATMERGDNRGLGDVWQSVVYERDIRWAITHGPSLTDPLVTAPVGAGAAHGWLVPPHGRVVVGSHMDLEHAKVSKGDFQDNELGEMVAQDVDQIVQAWLEHASERITVAFTPNVASAQALTQEFSTHGVPCGEVYGSTPAAERDLTYKALAAGDLRVLVSVMVPTEGWDCPPVSCVLVARPTQLPGLYQQMVGRGLRLSPQTGKTDCLVLDVVGASRTQRLITLIDLHETAAYDASALPPCEKCDQRPCACEKPERDPDGGRVKLQGPVKYETVDLFARSTLNWLFTRKGVRFVPAGDRLACIWTEPDGTFSAGHCATRGATDGQWLLEHATLDAALGAAEAWAVGHDPSTAKKASSWRRSQPPREKQVNYARNLGVAAVETMNKARLSDEISIVLASRRLDRAA